MNFCILSKTNKKIHPIKTVFPDSTSQEPNNIFLCKITIELTLNGMQNDVRQTTYFFHFISI